MGVDHFFLRGINGETWHFFHAVDHLTTMQAARLVRTESSQRCSQALEDMLISWAGPPRVVISDAGKGFVGREFKDMCEGHSIVLDPVATEAQWKNGAAERHGSILKIMMMKVMEETNVLDYEQMKTVLVQCVCAKNRLARRCGVPPSRP